jgi:hypothetical protein
MWDYQFYQCSIEISIKHYTLYNKTPNNVPQKISKDSKIRILFSRPKVLFLYAYSFSNPRECTEYFMTIE